MGERKKYKIVSEELVQNIISFLDEMQFDAAANTDKDSMHIVNFCSWAITELLNSYDGFLKKDKNNNTDKKSRNDYIEETFVDWNFPELSEDDYDKLVDQFDAFLKGWEKDYYKKPSKKVKKKKPKFKRPPLDDVIEYMDLKEIKEYLLDDPDITTEEAFDLYYDEHKRVQKKIERKNSQSLEDVLKKLKIDLPKDDEKN